MTGSLHTSTSTIFVNQVFKKQDQILVSYLIFISSWWVLTKKTVDKLRTYVLFSTKYNFKHLSNFILNHEALIELFFGKFCPNSLNLFLVHTSGATPVDKLILHRCRCFNYLRFIRLSTDINHSIWGLFDQTIRLDVVFILILRLWLIHCNL